tara:strand:+ start:539 stop:949 length:411 start_codon:yes stop_codon:yes gene_type:complete
MLDETNWNNYKGQKKDDESNECQDKSSFPKWDELSSRARMSKPQEKQYDSKYQVSQDRTVVETGIKADRNESSKSTVGNQAMTSWSKDGVDDVTSVELTDGKQIYAGSQHPKPGCPSDGMQIDTVMGTPREECYCG